MFSRERIVSSETDRFSSPAPLIKIVESFPLPMRLSLSESIYGGCATTDFISGALIDVHFCKETSVAKVQLESGKVLRIPVNARFKMNVIQSSEPKARARILSLSELMQTRPLPHIVTVVQTSKSHADFSKDEGLVIKRLNNRTIECYSLLTKRIKIIHKRQHSKLHFHVDPIHTDLCFSDVVAHLSFPLVVQLYPGEKRYAKHFTGHCRILNLITERSVIVSISNEKKSAMQLIEKRELMEILIELQLDFLKENISEDEKELLIQKSKALYSAFTPACIKKVIRNLSPILDIEQLVYEMHETGEQMMNGMHLVEPEHEYSIPLVRMSGGTVHQSAATQSMLMNSSPKFDNNKEHQQLKEKQDSPAHEYEIIPSYFVKPHVHSQPGKLDALQKQEIAMHLGVNALQKQKAAMHHSMPGMGTVDTLKKQEVAMHKLGIDALQKQKAAMHHGRMRDILFFFSIPFTLISVCGI